ncbi:MAG TPA: hypothetical protein VNZ49_05230 [Bacteroidia bacterium]|jgi:uncharacterized membrane-anchored protein|nr:hypothetical protein [Bacteroidia bacterium]
MDESIKNTGKQLINKVPQVTLFFWVIKVLCTTVGETFADFLNVNLNFGLTGTSVAMGILLMIALFFQFRAKKYIPAIYWITVVFISVFGTLVTDNLTDKMNVPLETSTIFFSILLLLTFSFWYAKEKTLSIHSIYTKTREVFYWLTILFTFALGTASGDLMAESLGLGYLVTGIIVSVVIISVVVARKLKLNPVLSFWIIYIMTRPLGASIGDLLSQPTKFGGLGLGATVTSALFLFGILGIILYFTFSKRDVITNPGIEEKGNTEGNGLIWQTVITVAVFIVVGGSAYFWRHNALQKEIEQPVSNAASAKNARLSPLGDLSAFIKITEDTRTLVVANNLAGATTRVADIEYEWDNAQSRLKPMNGAKWTEVDDAIDKVLRQLRAVNPNQQECKSSLDALLVVLK